MKKYLVRFLTAGALLSAIGFAPAAVAADPVVAKPDAVNTKFVADFTAKYGKAPDQFAAQAYDTMKIVAAAIDRAGAADSEKITAALAKTDFSGVMGPFKFTAGRDPASNAGVVVLEMRAGKFGIAP